MVGDSNMQCVHMHTDITYDLLLIFFLNDLECSNLNHDVDVAKGLTITINYWSLL